MRNLIEQLRELEPGASLSEDAADRIEQLEAALRVARGALATIHNNTEADAIKHRSYDELAAGIYGIAKAALDGEFVDDMSAAEVYDKLYPLAALTQSSPPKRQENDDVFKGFRGNNEA